jgi:hypothetical protein
VVALALTLALPRGEASARPRRGTAARHQGARFADPREPL